VLQAVEWEQPTMVLLLNALIVLPTFKFACESLSKSMSNFGVLPTYDSLGPKLCEFARLSDELSGFVCDVVSRLHDLQWDLYDQSILKKASKKNPQDSIRDKMAQVRQLKVTLGEVASTLSQACERVSYFSAAFPSCSDSPILATINDCCARINAQDFLSSTPFVAPANRGNLIAGPNIPGGNIPAPAAPDIPAPAAPDILVPAGSAAAAAVEEDVVVIMDQQFVRSASVHFVKPDFGGDVLHCEFRGARKGVSCDIVPDWSDKPSGKHDKFSYVCVKFDDEPEEWMGKAASYEFLSIVPFKQEFDTFGYPTCMHFEAPKLGEGLTYCVLESDNLRFYKCKDDGGREVKSFVVGRDIPLEKVDKPRKHKWLRSITIDNVIHYFTIYNDRHILWLNFPSTWFKYYFKKRSFSDAGFKVTQDKK
jgi:hypothetical protein